MEVQPLWTLALYFVLVVGMVVGIMLLSHVLGQRHSGRARDDPYESGMLPVGSARVRLSAKFYLIAVFFLIFDLEAVYLFAWAVAAREAGWAGYIEAVIFIVVLGAGLLYLWRLGALDWSPERRRRFPSV